MTDAAGESGSSFDPEEIIAAFNALGIRYVEIGAVAALMQMLSLTCRHGDFDLAFSPSGTDGYDDLVRSATAVVVGATEMRVASLDDVIRSKEAAGRPKDIAALPALDRRARDLRAMSDDPEGDSWDLPRAGE